LAILLYIFTLALIFIAAVYAVPGAVLTFKPEQQPINVAKQIVADPQLETINTSGASVPGRLLQTVQEWQAEVETTGSADIADSPARGTVLFVNQIDRPASVPAGTRVSTSGAKRVVFQTMESVTVPEGSGSSVEVEIVAIEPGVEGNVDPNLVNRIEGSLALQLQVRNLDPIEGGTVRQVLAVTEEDVERLRKQVVAQMETLALREMENRLLENEFLAADSLRITHIFHETFSHFPGEKTGTLAVDIRAAMEATAVDEAQAVELIFNELSASIPPGYEIIPDTLNFRGGEVLGVDGEGRVTFEMIADGQAAAQLDLEEALGQITGQDKQSAQAYLFELLPLEEYPSIDTWPAWFKRVPYLPIRLETVIET
jgi:hypothetical protein